jgi:hypothetical protein
VVTRARFKVSTNKNNNSKHQKHMKTMNEKLEIIRKQLESPFFGCDEAYVAEFESRFGELTIENFRDHCDDVDFTAWANEQGY